MIFLFLYEYYLMKIEVVEWRAWIMDVAVGRQDICTGPVYKNIILLYMHRSIENIFKYRYLQRKAITKVKMNFYKWKIFPEAFILVLISS